jgi:DmsE family decaheme c-type cytochrome
MARTFLTLAALVVLASPVLGQEPDGYAGSDACTMCHQATIAGFATTVKARLFLDHPRSDIERLGCEGCHGPARAHAASGGEERGGLISFTAKDPTPVETRNAVCLRCHAGGGRFFWEGSTHESRDVACTSCHRIMAAASERNQLQAASVTETCASCHPQRRAQMARVAHMPVSEGRLDCTSCHNPHGSAAEKLLVGNTVNDACYSCHAEKRGPFVWEHAPVTESCSNCHDPHGSTNDKLLVAPRPRLCQRCHIEAQHPTQPQATTGTRFLMGRQCQNCHSNIHGSNHPSGVRFTR